MAKKAKKPAAPRKDHKTRVRAAAGDPVDALKTAMSEPREFEEPGKTHDGEGLPIMKTGAIEWTEVNSGTWIGKSPRGRKLIITGNDADGFDVSRLTDAPSGAHYIGGADTLENAKRLAATKDV